jgi:hypothetical protein
VSLEVCWVKGCTKDEELVLPELPQLSSSISTMGFYNIDEFFFMNMYTNVFPWGPGELLLC